MQLFWCGKIKVAIESHLMYTETKEAQRHPGCNGFSRPGCYIREWGRAPHVTNTVGTEKSVRWRKPVIGET